MAEVYLPLDKDHTSPKQGKAQFSVEQVVTQLSVQALNVTRLPRARLLKKEHAEVYPGKPRIDFLRTEVRPVAALEIFRTSTNGRQALGNHCLFPNGEQAADFDR